MVRNNPSTQERPFCLYHFGSATCGRTTCHSRACHWALAARPRTLRKTTGAVRSSTEGVDRNDQRCKTVRHRLFGQSFRFSSWKLKRIVALSSTHRCVKLQFPAVTRSGNLTGVRIARTPGIHEPWRRQRNEFSFTEKRGTRCIFLTKSCVESVENNVRILISQVMFADKETKHIGLVKNNRMS